jgi:hypothetical protein
MKWREFLSLSKIIVSLEKRGGLTHFSNVKRDLNL